MRGQQEALHRADAPAPDPGSKLLQVTDLRAGYGDADVLHGLGLSVARGEMVVIVGPNGAGKSTLAKAIFGLINVRSGVISFDGHRIVGLKPSAIVQIGLCYVPQTRNVFANLSVHQNLEVGGYLLKRGDQLARALKRVYGLFPDLWEKRRSRAGTLSGGQRQMLAMGRALMLRPRLLVLDEPSAGLSPRLVDVVFEKILEINGSGCSILMVEQNARKALAMSDRGYVLDMGKNAVTGSGSELLADPKVIDLYLGGRSTEQPSPGGSVAEKP